MILDRISVDPHVLAGLPCVHPRGVPVAVVAALAAASWPVDEIVGSFEGLDEVAVQQAVAMPVWMMLPPGGLSAEQYDAMPEDVCGYIEVVDGQIVVRE